MHNSWIIFSLLPPMLWSITNHTDKFLVTKYLKGQGGASMMILTCLLAVFILPFIYIFNASYVSMSFLHIIILMISGACILINYICYIFALSGEETSIVIPLYQIIPVFSFIMGYVFLGEKLTSLQIVACLLIIFGSVMISLDLKSTKFKLKSKVLALMLSASFFAALNGLLFKIVALKETYWGSSFWLYAGLVLAAVIALFAFKTWREELGQVLKKHGKPVIGLNILNEAMNIGASLIFSYATLIAPLALVGVLSNGFQPIFVLLFAIILTIFVPRYASEELSKKFLLQKIVSILIIFLGALLLNR